MIAYKLVRKMKDDSLAKRMKIIKESNNESNNE